MTEKRLLGAPRRSRARKLPISGPLGAPLRWNPTKKGWSDLERACNIKFNDDFRDKVKVAVNQYFYWEPFERSAEPVSAALKTLSDARSLARNLSKLISSHEVAGVLVTPQWQRFYPLDHQPASAAEVDDETLYANLADEGSKSSARDHRDFLDVVRTIGTAIDETLRWLRRDGVGGFSEGDAWEKLIKDLASAFMNAGMKVSASKDSNGPPSLFVKFVRALQSGFEPVFQRHQHSIATLSKHLSEVIAAGRVSDDNQSSNVP